MFSYIAARRHFIKNHFCLRFIFKMVTSKHQVIEACNFMP